MRNRSTIQYRYTNCLTQVINNLLLISRRGSLKNRKVSAEVNNLTLSKLLEDSGIVSKDQIDKALVSQKASSKSSLGQILALSKVVDYKTINFFENSWEIIKENGYQFPLGYYLQKASLLNLNQIHEILLEQKIKNLKFGRIAVAKGWINSKTLHFFIDNLSANSAQLLSLDQLEEYDSNQLHLGRKFQNSSLLLSRILAWTGGNLALTRNICQVLANSDINIPLGKEFQVIDQLVETAIIKDWRNNYLGESIRLIKTDLDIYSRCSTLDLWQEYREVLISDSRIYKETAEQDELLDLGLLTLEQKDHLKIANLIFAHVFNQDFVAQEITKKQEELKINNKKHITIIKNNIKQEKHNPHNLINNNPNNLNNKYLTKENSFRINKKNLLFLGILISLFGILFPIIFRRETSTTETKKLEKICQNINIADSNSRLNSIFILEQEKKILDSKELDNSGDFPGNCAAKLEKMRMLAIPELGQDNNVLEAMRYLCNIPEESDSFIEAKIWVNRWKSSPTWTKEVNLYLNLESECPAGKA